MYVRVCQRVNEKEGYVKICPSIVHACLTEEFLLVLRVRINVGFELSIFDENQIRRQHHQFACVGEGKVGDGKWGGGNIRVSGEKG